MVGTVVGSIIFFFRSESLYTNCPAGFANLETSIPIENAGTDPAFYATEKISDEYVMPERMAELGFDHLLGMVNIVTAYPCDRGRQATVELRALRINHLDVSTGEFITDKEIRFDTMTKSTGDSMVTQTFRRTPWFTSGTPWLRHAVSDVHDGALRFDAHGVPEGIIHGWTTTRFAAEPGIHYFLEAEVRVTGDARLQLGMDYWKGESSPYNGWSEGCVKSNNCEAWLSDWIGDTGGEFRLVVAPRSFLVK